MTASQIRGPTRGFRRPAAEDPETAPPAPVVRWAKWLHPRDASAPANPAAADTTTTSGSGLAPTSPSHATAGEGGVRSTGTHHRRRVPRHTHAADHADVGAAAAGLLLVPGVAGVGGGVHQGRAGGVPLAAGVGGAGGGGLGRGGERGRSLVRGARGGARAGAALRRRRARGRRRRVEVRRGRARRAARVPGAPPRAPLHQVRSPGASLVAAGVSVGVVRGGWWDRECQPS